MRPPNPLSLAVILGVTLGACSDPHSTIAESEPRLNSRGNPMGDRSNDPSQEQHLHLWVDAEGLPQAKVTKRSDLPPDMAERLARVENDPAAQRMLKRHAEVVARGPLAIVLSEADLPGDALAIVKLNAPPPLSRYMVLPAAAMRDDEVFHRARGLASAYQMQHPEDDGEVTLTVLPGLSFIRESRQLGRYEGEQVFTWVTRKRDREVTELRREAAALRFEDVPGIGRAHVVRRKP